MIREDAVSTVATWIDIFRKVVATVSLYLANPKFLLGLVNMYTA